MSDIEITLVHPQTQETQTIDLGYSWLVMLFGFLVPLCRKEYKIALIFFIIYSFSLGVLSPFMAIFYNKLRLAGYLHQGYKIQNIDGDLDDKTLQELISKIRV